MTTKELLHRLVDDLDESAAVELLRYAEHRFPDEAESHRNLPGFVGILASGRPDVSENVDRYLAEGFGR